MIWHAVVRSMELMSLFLFIAAPNCSPLSLIKCVCLLLLPMLLPGPVMSNPTSKPLLHIPYTYIMAVTFSLPVVSLFSIVVLGVVLHFDQVTATHCRVSCKLFLYQYRLSPFCMWGLP